MTVHYRQGDVLLLKLDAMPLDAALLPDPEDRRIVLAYGEVTGHAHAVATEGARMYRLNEERFLEVLQPTSLVHEEHNPIALQPGVYRVVHQREYQPGAIRRVQD